ncbi:MAG: YfhO family protein, partial [Candidatus Aureabacteria bacterium]|nr:YfhO family protein [Candidatus Auribacterota bacterium]
GLSTRSAETGLAFVNEDSLEPHSLMGLVIPRSLGGGGENYIGPSVFILALIGFLSYNRFPKSAFGLATIFASLIALGKYTPLTYLLYHLLPGFAKFRCHSRTLVIFVMGASLFAGLGINFLTTTPARARGILARKLFHILIACVILLTVTAFARLCGEGFLIELGSKMYRAGSHGLPYEAHIGDIKEIIHKTLDYFLFFTLLASAAPLFLLVAERIRGRRVMYVIIAVSLIPFIADIWGIYRPITATKNPYDLLASPKIIEVLSRDRETSRYLNMGDCRALPSAIAIRYNLEDAAGYLVLLLRDYVDFTNLATRSAPEWLATTKLPLSVRKIDDIEYFNIIDLLNVKYLLSPTPVTSPRLKLIAEIEHPTWNLQWPYGVNNPEAIYIYENRSVLPRAFIVPRAEIVTDATIFFDTLKTFNPREVVLLGDEVTQQSEGEPYRAVPVQRPSPHRIRAEVHLAKPAFLVFSELWYPGWHAYDNGEKISLFKANYILRCVQLGKGKHSVELVFRPAIWKYGLLISLASCVLVISTIAYLCVRRGAAPHRGA